MGKNTSQLRCISSILFFLPFLVVFPTVNNLPNNYYTFVNTVKKMGTGFLAFMFALVGLYKYWGDSQFVPFVLLVIASYVVTELVRNDVKKNGIDEGNKGLVLSGMVLQIAVIIIGFASLLTV